MMDIVLELYINNNHHLMEYLMANLGQKCLYRNSSSVKCYKSYKRMFQAVDIVDLLILYKYLLKENSYLFFKDSFL